jgi:fermentation-respiration switch protein FrsA (DUF1100 family)
MQIEERERTYAGEPPTMIPVVTEPGAALATPDASEWFGAMAPLAPTWRNEVTQRSWERILEYSPLRFIDRIAPTPLLMIVAEHDTICPVHLAREALARAGEPKRLLELPIGHFDPYEPPHFATAAGAAAEWFATHLGR